jgi:hypothetical protein
MSWRRAEHTLDDCTSPTCAGHGGRNLDRRAILFAAWRAQRDCERRSRAIETADTQIAAHTSRELAADREAETGSGDAELDLCSGTARFRPPTIGADLT